jgi:phosphatidylinositol alpha-1,6-mannosyltransferase
VTAATAAGGGSQRPRTLLITRNLPPLRGGMERLNLHMAMALAEWSDLTVIGPTGCRELLPTVVEVHEVPARPLRSFLLRSLYAAWRAARERYDIVIAGSGLTALATQLAAWRSGARAAAYVHGLDLLAPHPLYRALWMPALRRLDLALANSANTARIAAEHGVANGRIDVVHPGVTLPGDAPDSTHDFRRTYGLGDRPILLSVGRLTARKGLVEFVHESLPAVRRQHPDVLLLVIGDEAPDALTGANSGGRAALEALATELGLAEHVRLLGPCSDEVLTQAYFAADVHVFPVRDLPGDVEGFGMVAIEAAAHGLPTVAFAVGGVPDAVSPGESGYLVTAGGYREFAGAICRVLEARHDRPLRAGARKFAESFCWSKFDANLRRALNKGRPNLTSSDSQATTRHADIKNFYDTTYYSGTLKPQRTTWHVRKIADRLDLYDGLNVLDIACGTGEWLAEMAARGARVSGIDISDRAIAVCKERLPGADVCTGIAEVLPFENDRFDLVTCLGSLEHFLDQSAALREMRRVAKPTARYLLLVPNAGFLTRRLHLYRGTGQASIRETVRSIADWRKLFNDAGLTVDTMWRDLHPLSVAWIKSGHIPGWPLRAIQAAALALWPLGWQYQIYFLCTATEAA